MPTLAAFLAHDPPEGQDKRKTFLKHAIKMGFELTEELHHGKGEVRLPS